MRQVNIRFDDNTYAKLAASAIVAGKKDVTAYCRDLIIENHESATMATSDVKTYIEKIQTQVSLMQQYNNEMLKLIYPLCVESSKTTQNMLKAFFEKLPNTRNDIISNTNKYVAKRYKDVFGEDYVKPDDE